MGGTRCVGAGIGGPRGQRGKVVHQQIKGLVTWESLETSKLKGKPSFGSSKSAKGQVQKTIARRIEKVKNNAFETHYQKLWICPEQKKVTSNL